MNKEEKSPNKCPICGRPTHKKSKYCIFHASAEEKTEKEFEQELKEYVNKIKKEDSDYDFKKFIFIGNINFKEDFNITIFKNADFMGATFEGNADFMGATFEGRADSIHFSFEKKVSFRKVTFKFYADFRKVKFERDRDADFGDTIFKRDASFKEATFKGKAFFWVAIFKRHAFFEKATFKEKAFFWETTFKEKADFGEAIFKEKADFREAIFKRDADFSESTFKGDVDFRIKTIKKDMIFSKALFNQGITLEINTLKIMNKVVIKFDNAYLENVYLELILGKKTSIYFNTKKILQNIVIKGNQIKNHIFQEEWKEFVQAKEIYLRLKNNFHSIGKYDDESWAFKKEKDMERLSQSFTYYKSTLKNKDKKKDFPIIKWIKKGYFKKWIVSAFSNMIYGYGEKPWNVILSAGALIILFAYFFTLIGIGNPEIIELHGKIHPIPGTDMRLTSEGVLQNVKVMQFSNCLYFSLITFTTLGYGDFRPLEGWGRILAGSEAFIGGFMMALFVYTFARRTGGR